MIISLVHEEIKPTFKDNIYFFEIEPSKLDVAPIKKYKTYKEYRITLDYKEITVCCPVYKNIDRNSIVYIPSYILPHRGYPVNVYLYAISLYLSSTLSMRATAVNVKKKFGLETFSHSTISRTLSRISENIHQITVATKDSKEDFALPILRADRPWEENMRIKYQGVLKYLKILLSTENSFSESCKLNYDYYKRTKRYII